MLKIFFKRHFKPKQIEHISPNKRKIKKRKINELHVGQLVSSGISGQWKPNLIFISKLLSRVPVRDLRIKESSKFCWDNDI